MALVALGQGRSCKTLIRVLGPEHPTTNMTSNSKLLNKTTFKLLIVTIRVENLLF